MQWPQSLAIQYKKDIFWLHKKWPGKKLSLGLGHSIRMIQKQLQSCNNGFRICKQQTGGWSVQLGFEVRAEERLSESSTQSNLEKKLRFQDLKIRNSGCLTSLVCTLIFNIEILQYYLYFQRRLSCRCFLINLI